MRETTLDCLFFTILFLICVGLAVRGPQAEPKVEVQPKTVRAAERPDLCYLGAVPSREACKLFGGYKRVWWETVCQPDPKCLKLPDGTDYAKP